MKKINKITKEIKDDILVFLYKSELVNIIFINQIENERINDLYISYNGESIDALMHIKFDGNSNYVTFDYSNEERLKDIYLTLKNSNYKEVLLSGKYDKVKKLYNLLNNDNRLTENVIFSLLDDILNEKFNNLSTNIRIANDDYIDYELIKKYFIKFYEAETNEEIEAVTEDGIINDKVSNGLFILEYLGESIGMARFVGKTKNYIEISSVYIQEEFRGNGFGKELIFHMIQEIKKLKKKPILMTSRKNLAAFNTYKSMGFDVVDNYAFEFVSLID